MSTNTKIDKLNFLGILIPLNLREFPTFGNSRKLHTDFYWGSTKVTVNFDTPEYTFYKKWGYYPNSNPPIINPIPAIEKAGGWVHNASKAAYTATKSRLIAEWEDIKMNYNESRRPKAKRHVNECLPMEGLKKALPTLRLPIIRKDEFVSELLFYNMLSDLYTIKNDTDHSNIIIESTISDFIVLNYMHKNEYPIKLKRFIDQLPTIGMKKSAILKAAHAISRSNLSENNMDNHNEQLLKASAEIQVMILGRYLARQVFKGSDKESITALDEILTDLRPTSYLPEPYLLLPRRIAFGMVKFYSWKGEEIIQACGFNKCASKSLPYSQILTMSKMKNLTDKEFATLAIEHIEANPRSFFMSFWNANESGLSDAEWRRFLDVQYLRAEFDLGTGIRCPHPYILAIQDTILLIKEDNLSLFGIGTIYRFPETLQGDAARSIYLKGMDVLSNFRIEYEDWIAAIQNTTFNDPLRVLLTVLEEPNEFDDRIFY